MVTTKAIVGGVAGVALLLGSQIYGDWSTRHTAETRVSELETQIQGMRDAESSRTAQLIAELDSVQKRFGTEGEVTQKMTASVRQEQAKAVGALRQSLAEHQKAVDALRAESGTKLEEVRAETASQLGAVSGEVGTVKTDLDLTKSDLAASRREIGDVRDSLGRQIAHNADELSVLKRRGERDYFEFDVRKKDVSRVAGIRIELNKADAKAHKYDVTLQVDDSRIQKKNLIANEPLTFLVGKERDRYEFVVNSVEKDLIRGYVSRPKSGGSDNAVALRD